MRLLSQLFSAATALLALSSLLCVLSPANAIVIPPSSPTEPFYTSIDFNLPARDRWTELITAVLDYNGFDNSYGKVLDFIEYDLPHGKEIIDTLETTLVAMGERFLHSEVFAEIQGIYSVFEKYSKRMTLGRLVLLNMFYDVTAGCTSVVAASTSPRYCRRPLSSQPNAPRECANATRPVPIHGRNLDFPIPGLANVTSVVHMVRGDETIATGVFYAGYVGVLTGQRRGGWSVSVNQRNRHWWTHEEFHIITNLIAFLSGAESTGVFLRDSLLNIPTYAQAVEKLSTQVLPAPVYLIVAGARDGEGAVLTRNRFGLDLSHGKENAVWSIEPTAPVRDDRFASRGNSSWFRAETNEDHWDAPRDKRRAAINDNMSAIGQASIDVSSVLYALNQQPTRNDWTTFSTVMSPEFDAVNITVHRDAPSNKRFGGEKANMDAVGELFYHALSEPASYRRKLGLKPRN